MSERSAGSSSLPYKLDSYYDEAFDAKGKVRNHYEHVLKRFEAMNEAEIEWKQSAVQSRMMQEGITFTLYNPVESTPLERTIPFDLIPRVIPQAEWSVLEKGLLQRVRALNQFVRDIYHEQQIVKDRIVPRKMIYANCYFRPEMYGLQVPGDAYLTTAGIDLIRDRDGKYMVLEDNLRSPSGFSYLFKSRSVMTRVFPDLSLSCSIRDIEHSMNHFLTTLRSLARTGGSDPVVALLTPGEYNSAYFEHVFLAQQMGIQLVEGRDMVVMDHKVYIRGLKGLQKVDVLYRRIDDEYLDPLAFHPDSMLGIAGVMNAYRAGNVAIANAPGTGVADDKAMYAYVPDMIRYYLNEEPLIDNVPTYLLSKPEEREYVLERLDRMVVKETSLSGGYGMLIGPSATEEELALFASRIQREPDRYIAQPTIALSRAPVWSGGRMTPRHIDLRAFVLTGADNRMHVVPGGLTRVAMKEGSLVVNSSQGGGCKDTWVLTEG